MPRKKSSPRSGVGKESLGLHAVNFTCFSSNVFSIVGVSEQQASKVERNKKNLEQNKN